MGAVRYVLAWLAVDIGIVPNLGNWQSPIEMQCGIHVLALTKMLLLIHYFNFQNYTQTRISGSMLISS